MAARKRMTKTTKKRMMRGGMTPSPRPLGGVREGESGPIWERRKLSFGGSGTKLAW